MHQKNKGNFGFGRATNLEAEALGKDWVGKGYRIYKTAGRTWISSNGLRQYRPPSSKPNSKYASTGTQANFESRFSPNGPWQANGHLDIIP